MSLKNSQESYTNSESEITNQESNISEKKYYCDADCVCERCSLQKKLMKEITEEINEINEINTKNKTLSDCPNDLIKETVDSLLSQNYVIDFQYRGRLEKNPRDKLSLSDENVSYVTENKNNSAQHCSDFTVKDNDSVFSNEVEKETSITRTSSDYNTNADRELSPGINAVNEVKGYFSNFKAKYDDMVFKYVRTETGFDQESHSDFKSKKEGREYSCDFVGENKLRIFSNDPNEDSRDFSENDCRNFSSDHCGENADKEFSEDLNSNNGVEKSSLFNLKPESENQELSSDFNAGNDGGKFSTDFSSQNVGREFPTNFSAETQLGGLTCDLNTITKSRELSSEIGENRDFAVDSVTEGKTFFVHFKAKTGGKEDVLSGVHDGKEGKELSGDLKDGRNYSCECTTFEESSDASTEIYDFSNIPDCRRTRRCSKRKRDIEDFCPICGVTVRCSELSNHFEKEVENLSKLSKGPKKIRFDENQGVSTTYVQVRSNRENRHAAKVSKYSRSRNEVYCPVCNFRLTGTQDEINTHVLHCINEDGEYEEVNILESNDFANAEYDDENSFEEWEFGDQTRIRAISMVPGGYRSLHGDSSRPRRSVNDEEEGDLNVDVDDTLAFGNPQYTELDVIHNEADTGDKHELEQLRKAVLMDPSAERHVIESRKWANDSDKKEHPDNSSSSSDKIEAGPNAASNAGKNKEENGSCVNKEANHVISSLKEKIKDFEEQNSSVKCLICLEPYTKPVVSTTCWHVHCEECWLMTMGVKKLCPQCNMIVFPSDLRRIYL